MEVPPPITSRSWSIIDGSEGTSLLASCEHVSRQIASLTKMMTMYVVLKLASFSDGMLEEAVLVSPEAASVSGTSAGLRSGEIYRLRDLLYGLMLPSGNDAALALAEYVGDAFDMPPLGNASSFSSFSATSTTTLGGALSRFSSGAASSSTSANSTTSPLSSSAAAAFSGACFSSLASTEPIFSSDGQRIRDHPLTRFVAEMNREASRLGLRNTRFVNPHGLSDADTKQRLQSSAADVNKLTQTMWKQFPQMVASVCGASSHCAWVHALPSKLSALTNIQWRAHFGGGGRRSGCAADGGGTASGRQREGSGGGGDETNLLQTSRSLPRGCSGKAATNQSLSRSSSSSDVRAEAATSPTGLLSNATTVSTPTPVATSASLGPRRYPFLVSWHNSNLLLGSSIHAAVPVSIFFDSEMLGSSGITTTTTTTRSATAATITSAGNCISNSSSMGTSTFGLGMIPFCSEADNKSHFSLKAVVHQGLRSSIGSPDGVSAPSDCRVDAVTHKSEASSSPTRSLDVISSSNSSSSSSSKHFHGIKLGSIETFAAVTASERVKMIGTRPPLFFEEVDEPPMEAVPVNVVKAATPSSCSPLLPIPSAAPSPLSASSVTTTPSTSQQLRPFERPRSFLRFSTSLPSLGHVPLLSLNLSMASSASKERGNSSSSTPSSSKQVNSSAPSTSPIKIMNPSNQRSMPPFGDASAAQMVASSAPSVSPHLSAFLSPTEINLTCAATPRSLLPSIPPFGSSSCNIKFSSSPSSVHSVAKAQSPSLASSTAFASMPEKDFSPSLDHQPLVSSQVGPQHSIPYPSFYATLNFLQKTLSRRPLDLWRPMAARSRKYYGSSSSSSSSPVMAMSGKATPPSSPLFACEAGSGSFSLGSSSPRLPPSPSSTPQSFSGLEGFSLYPPHSFPPSDQKVATSASASTSSAELSLRLSRSAHYVFEGAKTGVTPVAGGCLTSVLRFTRATHELDLHVSFSSAQRVLATLRSVNAIPSAGGEAAREAWCVALMQSFDLLERVMAHATLHVRQVILANDSDCITASSSLRPPHSSARNFPSILLHLESLPAHGLGRPLLLTLAEALFAVARGSARGCHLSSLLHREDTTVRITLDPTIAAEDVTETSSTLSRRCSPSSSATSASASSSHASLEGYLNDGVSSVDTGPSEVSTKDAPDCAATSSAAPFFDFLRHLEASFLERLGTKTKSLHLSSDSATRNSSESGSSNSCPYPLLIITVLRSDTKITRFTDTQALAAFAVRRLSSRAWA